MIKNKIIVYEVIMVLKEKGLNSFQLHLIAIVSMLIDHIGMVLFPKCLFLRYIGRIAFPLFSFMLVEGLVHTSNKKKYLLRLFLFAIISEIPYNLMVIGKLFAKYNQNIYFTLFVALLLLCFLEKMSWKDRGLLDKIILLLFVCLVGYFLGNFLFLDYLWYGIFVPLLFYIVKGKDNKTYLNSAVILFILSLIAYGLYGYKLTLGNIVISIPIQAFCVISYIFICKYNGEQGYYNKWVKLFYYTFYPLHILVLVLLRILL